MSGEPEFSRLLGLEKIDRNGMRRTIWADKDELTALACRFGILAINSLSASLRIQKSIDSEMVTVQGDLSARVQQKCTILLDPFDVEISAKIDQIFLRAGSCKAEALMSLEEEGSYDDELEGNTIDLGEMTAQCLALELDPYPRKPGVKYLEESEIMSDSEVFRPFSVLARLKQDDQ